VLTQEQLAELLRDCFRDECKVVLLANVSPLSSDQSATFATLEFVSMVSLTPFQRFLDGQTANARHSSALPLRLVPRPDALRDWLQSAASENPSGWDYGWSRENLFGWASIERS